jgi:hypothetical protein
MRLTNRLAKLEKQAQDRPRADQLDVVEAIPVANAGGRAPGLYNVGAKGSTVGAWVYDPADGDPQLPRDERTRSALFIVCEPASFQPGVDYIERG